MTKREALRQTTQENTLMSLGFTQAEAESLRRISMTLHRWFEGECGIDNGCIERDETTNKAYWLNSVTMRRYPIPDRETGARKRLDNIVAERNKRLRVANAIGDVLGPATTNVQSYIQGDPRGAVLYILRPGDVPADKTADSYYTRGIVVY